MKDRLVLQISCPKCGYYDDEVYYAPNAGMTIWRCPNCKNKYSLKKFANQMNNNIHQNREKVKT